MDHELLGEAQERPDTQLPCQCLAEPGLPAFHSPAPKLRERKNVIPYERGLSKVYKQISKFDNELFQLDSGGSRC